jgi:hypothetical protein
MKNSKKVISFFDSEGLVMGPSGLATLEENLE